MANAITASRMLAALALLFVEVASPAFWGLYAWCGISDMVDGAVARKLGEQSEFGAKLDSAADLIFVAVCLVRVTPALQMPAWLIAWIAVIALCKIAGYASGLAMHGKVVALHTAANKVAGLLVFASVPIMPFTGYVLAAVPACAVATYAAIQEGFFIRTGNS